MFGNHFETLMLVFFFFYFYVENFVCSKLATVDILIWCIHFTCWIAKVADTHPEYIKLTVFPC
jgi:hypothetical protein